MPIRMINFAFKINLLKMDSKIKHLNRIKIVLIETGHTGIWLARQLGKDPATISKWCTNTTQPDLYTFEKIAKLLNVPIRNLITADY